MIHRLEALSDRLSPIVVKEVRQMVRGREFNYTFGLSLLVGLLVAFFGGTNALADAPVSGIGIFSSLMACLFVVGMIVVPIGAFNALRQERAEQTLDLVTITALTPRRLVVGKLLAQGVKLVTLFAALSPFITMSFLLGGIDFVTILTSLSNLFVASLWVCALCVFLSCLSKSRLLSGMLFAVVGITFLVAISFGPSLIYMLRYGSYYGGSVGLASPIVFASTARPWWSLVGSMSIVLVTMTNLVLLAENRLSLPTENRSTALRMGFFIQFVFFVTWALLHVASWPAPAAPTIRPPDVVALLGILAGLHLAAVSLFTVTEDLVLSRRVLLQTKRSRWRLVLPGGGRGAGYVLVQMGILLFVGWQIAVSRSDFRWLLAICSYICFFTGLTAYIGRAFAPLRVSSTRLRAGIFVIFPLVMLVSEILSYFLGGKRRFDISVFHVVHPFRALANWSIVEQNSWYWAVYALGIIGLFSYVMLIRLGGRIGGEAVSGKQTH